MTEFKTFLRFIPGYADRNFHKYLPQTCNVMTFFRHKYSVHFTDKYKCKVCGKHFGISTQLKKHMAVHEPEGRFECELCGARLKGKSSMTEHMRVHRGEKPFK